MFSSDMLANIIRYYGHAMQGLMGSYLERSIFAFHEAQKRFQGQANTLYGELPKTPVDALATMLKPGQQVPVVMGGYLEQGAQAVIDMQEELRRQALKLFSGFPYSPDNGVEPESTQQAAAPAAKPKAARASAKSKSRK